MQLYIIHTCSCTCMLMCTHALIMFTYYKGTKCSSLVSLLHLLKVHAFGQWSAFYCLESWSDRT